MRSIPIDDFLEEAEERRGGPAATVASFRGRDWGSLVAEGRAARVAADGGRWRIGQLATLVEKRYRAGMLRRFADEIGESYGTVRRYRWVVGRYDAGVRFPFPNLSFSHFQAAAGLPERVRWLERAERGCWSVDRLVRESRGEAKPDPAAPVRRPIEIARRSLERLAGLEVKEIARADRDWLTRSLDELEAEIDRLRDRLREPSDGRTLSIGRATPRRRPTKRRQD